MTAVTAVSPAVAVPVPAVAVPAVTVRVTDMAVRVPAVAVGVPAVGDEEQRTVDSTFLLFEVAVTMIVMTTSVLVLVENVLCVIVCHTAVTFGTVVAAVTFGAVVAAVPVGAVSVAGLPAAAVAVWMLRCLRTVLNERSSPVASVSVPEPLQFGTVVAADQQVQSGRDCCLTVAICWWLKGELNRKTAAAAAGVS